MGAYKSECSTDSSMARVLHAGLVFGLSLVICSLTIFYPRTGVTEDVFVSVSEDAGYTVEWLEVDYRYAEEGSLGSRWSMYDFEDWDAYFGCDTMVYPTVEEAKELYETWRSRFTVYRHNSLYDVRENTNFGNYEYFECKVGDELFIVARIDNFVIDMQACLSRELEAKEFMNALGIGGLEV